MKRVRTVLVWPFREEFAAELIIFGVGATVLAGAGLAPFAALWALAAGVALGRLRERRVQAKKASERTITVSGGPLYDELRAAIDRIVEREGAIR